MRRLLYTRPRLAPTPEPVLDGVTEKMTLILRQARRGESFLGHHDCTGRGCSARSENYDCLFEVRGRVVLVTNTLAVHYLAHHRIEVPPEELQFVRDFPFRFAPQPWELRGLPA